MRREEPIDEARNNVARDFSDDLEEMARQINPDILERDYKEEQELSMRKSNEGLYQREFKIDEELMARDFDDLEELD